MHLCCEVNQKPQLFQGRDWVSGGNLFCRCSQWCQWWPACL
ncbi:rCG61460 [Rattus norvegicus]|uniref:RCG61460 n=1 Tax=Rattus norvegicus TaxID=10116 RepID=A6HC01_RAT|nr:rCG61460 [Rattus norvegicus]